MNDQRACANEDADAEKDESRNGGIVDFDQRQKGDHEQQSDPDQTEDQKQQGADERHTKTCLNPFDAAFESRITKSQGKRGEPAVAKIFHVFNA